MLDVHPHRGRPLGQNLSGDLGHPCHACDVSNSPDPEKTNPDPWAVALLGEAAITAVVTENDFENLNPQRLSQILRFILVFQPAGVSLLHLSSCRGNNVVPRVKGSGVRKENRSC